MGIPIYVLGRGSEVQWRWRVKKRSTHFPVWSSNSKTTVIFEFMSTMWSWEAIPTESGTCGISHAIQDILVPRKTLLFVQFKETTKNHVWTEHQLPYLKDLCTLGVGSLHCFSESGWQVEVSNFWYSFTPTFSLYGKFLGHCIWAASRNFILARIPLSG